MIFVLSGARTVLLGGLGCVYCTFWGVFFICPLYVAVDSGRYFFTAVVVSPGHDLKWPLAIAFIHVDGGSENTH